MCADVADYTLKSGCFDLVAVLHLHLPSDLRSDVPRRAAAGVAPGGTLLVVGHDTTNLTDGHGGRQDPDILFSSEDALGRARRPVGR